MSRQAWTVIICGGVVLSLCAGLRQTLGLFLPPITEDLGLGRGTFALSMALMNLVWGLGSPVAGAIADRWGPAKVGAVGGVFYAAGLVALALATDGVLLVAGGMLIGLGLSGAAFSVVLGAAGKAAPPEQRSLALGYVALGGSFGQFILVPYSQLMIDSLGWSGALIVLAGTALLMIPLSAGIAGQVADGAMLGGQSLRQALDEATRHRGFWLLTAGFFVCGFHLAFVSVHVPAYLIDRGMPGWLGAAMLTVIGFCNIVRTWACGVLGQRYPKKDVLAGLYLARGLIFLGFLVAPLSEVSVLVFAGALGLLWLGTVPLTSGVIAVIFGPAYMSMLYGVVFLSHQVGGFLGAWLAGVAYDAFGSYDAMWWLCVVLGLASAALHWPIQERPVPRLVPA